METLIKVITVLAVFITGITTVHAQEIQTLIGNDVNYGGFGGPVVKFSDVNGDLGVWVGGRGGWIINFDRNHAISLGGGGYGLATEHRVPDPEFGEPDTDYYAMTGYGGFEMEYINRSYELAHLTLSALIGGGGLMARERDFSDVDSHYDHYFVFEPGANLEINVTNFFRLMAGVSYRLTSGIESAGFTDDDFSGFNGTITFKFGKFR